MKHARSRRWFLRGAAGATLALPFLPSLASRALAGGPTAPKRIVFVYGQQQESELFLPPGSGASFTLDGTYLDPLAAYRDRMTILHNLTGTSGHSGGHSELLSGHAWGYDDSDMADHWRPRGGPTLDQYIASRIGTETPLPTLGLTISDQGLGRDDHETSWRRLPNAGEEGMAVLPSAPGSVVAVPHVRSPLEAYTTVFGSGAPSPMVDRSMLLRRSLIDSVIGDFDRVERTVSAADRRVLDAHLTQLREYETRLGSATPFTCDGGAGAPAAGDIDRPTSARLHMDTIVGAFRCDATRVATFTFAWSGDEHEYPWLDVRNFHQVAHNNADYTSDARGDHAKVRRWQMQQLQYLVDQLAAAPEGDGTLLDNTIVVWLTELGIWTYGAEGNDHLRTDAPGLVIGNAGGALTTGQIFDAGGAHYQRYLLTLLHAYGYADVASWGTEGSAPIPGLLA